MKYDDASWHSGGDFPADLPPEAAATHTGIFVSWAVLSGLSGEIHVKDSPEAVLALQSRAMTPGAFFLQYCDGKFTDEDLSEEGNAFAAAYFDFETGQFLRDYEAILGSELPDLYYVADTWANFDIIKPTLDQRLLAWRAAAV